MTELQSNYRSGSSADQIKKMHQLIAQKWKEVWTVVEIRHELGQESLMTELKLVPDNFLSLEDLDEAA